MGTCVYSSVSSSVVPLLMAVAEMNTNRIMIRLCKFLIPPGSNTHSTSFLFCRRDFYNPLYQTSSTHSGHRNGVSER